ncbi:ubiquitinyl hydrolase [Ascodesmis nigricans]|uniref:Ubiquitin carboxyl-terminal hydrolase n=1 Tax=Ascodesmis nigricans TaxID=341454 RepID=A0A4S2N0U7_9PEZI|nr:ubiquitinyl hydrolase [Ascodesmis nigricans]
MSCAHISSSGLQPPRATQAVHREDCTQCFDSIDSPQGLNVCLSCFNGGCVGDRNHAALHHKISQHPLVLNIRRTKQPRVERDEPPQKMSKLAIAAETESDKYDTHTAVFCYDCGYKEVERTTGNLPQVIDGIMKAMTFATQTEVKAWEQEITPCEHTLCLEQTESKKLESQNLAHCAKCDLKENLWLCLQCGNLGCGRAQFGGVGGNSHGLAHFDETKHPVAVKLGSITPEGTADIYCYSCNDERMDPEIAAHLAHWGINIAEREKTEKSLTEMQIEQNLRWEFSMTSEDGKELKPVFGKGLTGLKNLGNSCYLASILQCLFSLPAFKERYYDKVQGELPAVLDPAEDLETQLRKIGDGLWSGRYSKPDSDVTASEYSPEIPHQKGLAPAMLKALIGKGHEEFSTMRQQDAFELLLHLFSHIEKQRHPQGLKDPVSDFRFVLEQRLQCLGCKKVAYRTDVQDNISVPVPARKIETLEAEVKEGEEAKEKKDAYEPVTIKECLDIFTANERVEFTCKSCGSKEGALKRSGFKTFPNVLVINCRRFSIVNWVPTKLDIPIVVSDSGFTLDPYLSNGLQPGEEELPDSTTTDPTPSFTPNPEAMALLTGMGFPEPRCEKALYNTGNTDGEAAMNWLFAHMEDPDIDEPLVIPSSKPAAGPTDPDPEKIEMVQAMGFTAAQAKKALKKTNGNVEVAVGWIFENMEDSFVDDEDVPIPDTSSGVKEKEVPGNSTLPANFKLDSIVCHKGGSIHAGHYVAFVKKDLTETGQGGEGEWVLFNDEKVVRSGGDAEEMMKFAYVYFFKRV